MNQYYNFVEPQSPGEIVDSIKYNLEMELITNGFDLLPPAVLFNINALTYTESDGTDSHKTGLINFGFNGLTYAPGDIMAVNVNSINTSTTTIKINEREHRPVTFDVYGGAVGNDLKMGGIYTFVYDGSRHWCLEMSTRYLKLTAAFYIQVMDAFNTARLGYNQFSRQEYVTGSVELFQTGDDPNILLPGTVWQALADSVDIVTSGMVSSPDIIAWERIS